MITSKQIINQIEKFKIEDLPKNIVDEELNILTQSPYGTYAVMITGELGVYCDEDEKLDIESDWQVTVEYATDITILEYDIVLSDQLVFEVAPYPFIPSRGEKIY